MQLRHFNQFTFMVMIVLTFALVATCNGCLQLAVSEHSIQDTTYVSTQLPTHNGPGHSPHAYSPHYEADTPTVTIQSKIETQTPWYAKLITTIGFLLLLATVLRLIIKLYTLYTLL